MCKPPFTIAQIEEKVYELLNSFEEFKDNKPKQNEAWEEHRELLEAYAISSLKLELFEDDLPQAHEDEKMRKFNELEVENTRLYVKILNALNVEPPLYLDDSRLEDTQDSEEAYLKRFQDDDIGVTR